MNGNETTNSLPTPAERWQYEFRPSYPLFSLQEPCGNMVNVQECFAPRRKCCLSLVLRLLFLALAVQVLYYDVVYTYPRHNLWIYLGYLTHWGHVLLILYQFCSLFCCILPSVTKQSDDTPHTFIKWTWGLFSLVAPLQLCIFLLYWCSGIFIWPPTYASIMEHGVLGAIVWIDGFIVGNIPVRAKHVMFLVVTAVLYLTWTIINAILEIGNGEWGPAYNDDALYPVLNWNKQTRAAGILSAFVVVILAPALFYVSWLTSLASPRRKSNDGNTVKEADDDEDSNVAMEEGNRCCCHGCCRCFACACCVCDGSRRPLYNVAADSTTTTSGNEFDYNAMGSKNGFVV